MKIIEIYSEKSGIEPQKYPLIPSDGEGDENGGSVTITFNEREIIFRFECPYEGSLVLPYSAYNDPVWRGEAVEVFISPHASHKNYFEFDAAPNNSCYNAEILNVGEPCVFTRGINDAPVSYTTEIHKSRYTVETRIPFSLLTGEDRCPSEIPWIFNAYRIARGKETKAFALSPTEQPSFHVPEKFIGLKFTEDKN